MAVSLAVKAFLINTPRTGGQSTLPHPRSRSWVLPCIRGLRSAAVGVAPSAAPRPRVAQQPQDPVEPSSSSCAGHAFCHLCKSYLSGYFWGDQRRRASAAIRELGRAYRSDWPGSLVRKPGAALDRLGARGVVGSVGVRGGARCSAAPSGVWYGSHPWCRRDGPAHCCQFSRDARHAKARPLEARVGVGRPAWTGGRSRTSAARVTVTCRAGAHVRRACAVRGRWWEKC
jgi:hypothetical protein